MFTICPLEANMSWRVSTSESRFCVILSVANLVPGAVRRILKIQLGTKPVMRKDMEDLRSILLELQLNLNSIINRIPEVTNARATSATDDSPSIASQSPVEVRSTDTELPGEGPNRCPEQYHTPVLVAFHKWARILLSLFIDKVSSLKTWSTLLVS